MAKLIKFFKSRVRWLAFGVSHRLNEYSQDMTLLEDRYYSMFQQSNIHLMQKLQSPDHHIHDIEKNQMMESIMTYVDHLEALLHVIKDEENFLWKQIRWISCYKYIKSVGQLQKDVHEIQFLFLDLLERMKNL